MPRINPEIFTKYEHDADKLPSVVVYQERPNYPQNQIRSIGNLIVGTTVWCVHPGKYSSRTPRYIEDAMWSDRKAVGPPQVTWYDKPYLERLEIIGTGIRVRAESGNHHTTRLVWVPDPNAFFAEGEGLGEGGPQGYEGSTSLSLTAEDVGMKPYLNSDGEERWSTSYLIPIQPDDVSRSGSNQIIHPSRLTSEEIIKYIPGTEYIG